MDERPWALVEVGDRLYYAEATAVLPAGERFRQPLVTGCQVFENAAELPLEGVDDETLFRIYAALDDKAEEAWSVERARAAREKRRAWFRREDT